MIPDPRQFPRQRLLEGPTPIIGLDRLTAQVREQNPEAPKIWMKRDDLTGLGMGGNKLRKLEFLAGEAMELHKNVLITAGAAQSNHCRQTAAVAARLGMECVLLLGEPEGTIQNTDPSTMGGNILLDHLLGAEILWSGNSRKGEDLIECAEKLEAKGQSPYIIPYGGSNWVGALGFVQAFEEVMNQAKAMNTIFDAIVFASSSGGTHAGLMAGSLWLNQPTHIVGIEIEKSTEHELSTREKIRVLLEDMARRLPIDLHDSKINLIERFSDRPYGECSSFERSAIQRVARAEGILLDPVYTGRAMAGCLALLEDSFFEGMEHILFWHTGGLPALFPYASDLIADP